MEQIARAGILTGISMMPILPGVCDGDENLEATVRWTREYGAICHRRRPDAGGPAA
jgi:DNA repair photolyase